MYRKMHDGKLTNDQLKEWLEHIFFKRKESDRQFMGMTGPGGARTAEITLAMQSNPDLTRDEAEKMFPIENYPAGAYIISAHYDSYVTYKGKPFTGKKK